MHQEKIGKNKNGTYTDLGYSDIDHIRPIPIQETNLPIVRNRIDYQSIEPKKILKTANDFDQRPGIERTFRFADRVEVIPRLNLGEVSYRVQEVNKTFQLYDQSEDHNAGTEPLQLEGNRRKLSRVHKFRQELNYRKIQCEKLFDPDISVDKKLDLLSNIQEQNRYFYRIYHEYFEAYRQYIQKTHRYISPVTTVKEVTDYLSALIEKCNTIHGNVNKLNKEEFVPEEILEDVWDIYNDLMDLKGRWRYLDDLNFDDDPKSPLKKIRDMIHNRSEGIENCISILAKDLNDIHDIDDKHYAQLQLEEFRKFDAINLDISNGFTYDDILRAHGIIRNIMNIYDGVAKKYKVCFKNDPKFDRLYTGWVKYCKELNERRKKLKDTTASIYKAEANEFNRERLTEDLDGNVNLAGIKLTKSIQYVENRLEKIKYIAKKYPMNVEVEKEDTYWRSQTARYLKIRDNLLELEWNHYIKQKDNYINYERLFNECVGRRVDIMRLDIMMSTIVYSISRIQRLFPNVLSSNGEENEFWKGQERKYLGK